MSKFEVRDVVCDYGIYENGELKLILNSRGSALKILKILEFDNSLINEARPYNDTNFDKIVENVGTFAKWFVELSKTKSIDCDFTYYYNLGTPSYGKWTEDKEEAINGAIEWLQMECDND